MTNLLPLINSKLTPEMQGILYFVSSQASQTSEQIYCAGGFVRDLLLHKESRKVNLIVAGSAVDFARQLTTVFPCKLTVCERFGTATLILSKGFVFDMVTARKEFNPFAGVKKSSSEQDLLKNDLFQRDFTVDTLACSLNRDTFGEVYDYFGGLADLKNETLRVLYRLSFAENPLRILRLIRFEQILNFSIEDETNRLLHQAIANNILSKASKESLSQEIRLFFQDFSSVKILLRLVELNLFKQLFPRINLNGELLNRLNCLEEILERMEKGKTFRQKDCFLLFLCLLFSDLSEHDFHFLCHFMRLKRNERFIISTILKKKFDFQKEDGCLTLVNTFFQEKISPY